jgi:hypothetical protein
LRAQSFEERVLCGQWQGAPFTIWGAGRDGKTFFNLLSVESRRKVRAFCDIDPKKIERGYHWTDVEAGAEDNPAGGEDSAGSTSGSGEGRVVVVAAAAAETEACSKRGSEAGEAGEAGEGRRGKKRKLAKIKRKNMTVKIPVVHFREAKGPIVCCVAMGRTGGEFEKNVSLLGLEQGETYWHFV